MGQRTEYKPGTFSWTDLSTTDQEGAKAFYTALFGWDVQDNPVGDDMVYSMMLVDGQPVAAISPQPEQQREMGAPPMWNSYITVADADAALERAKELGGTVHSPAFDVMDAGRMGVVQDPQGAYFEVWQPKAHIGAHLVNGPGLLSWNELDTSDPEAAGAFYSDLFGWNVDKMDMGGMEYRVVAVDGHGNGGIRGAMVPGVPPHWLVYFGTDDLDGSLAASNEHGGTLLAEPMDIGEGNRIAIARDPQGAVFALYTGHFED
jgi:predicted enzyme related to lactoylglutathione lyase